MEGIDTVLPRVLRRMGVAGHVREAQACSAFAEACGEFLRPHVRALRLEGGALVVACSHPAVAHQLQLEVQPVLDAVNRAIGPPPVRRLRFVGDPAGGPPSR
ncbi:MAG TPA: DUF721 domain-containing protein [Candidatus Dormibacteraeota bacterium]|nr:DUF721 domain-containing protein [Candidatus Dormibacteraeota bacterium]